MITALIIILWILAILLLIVGCLGLYILKTSDSKSEQMVTVVPNKTTTKKEHKKKYLDFVYLTDDEYKKLIAFFWSEERLKKEINKLNDYIGKSWRKYKSHYFTLRSWNQELSEKSVIQEDLFKKDNKNISKIELRKWEIIFLHKAWWTHTKIAQRIGCTPQGIWQAIRRREKVSV